MYSIGPSNFNLPQSFDSPPTIEEFRKMNIWDVKKVYAKQTNKIAFIQNGLGYLKELLENTHQETNQAILLALVLYVQMRDAKKEVVDLIPVNEDYANVLFGYLEKTFKEYFKNEHLKNLFIKINSLISSLDWYKLERVIKNLPESEAKLESERKAEAESTMPKVPSDEELSKLDAAAIKEKYVACPFSQKHLVEKHVFNYALKLRGSEPEKADNLIKIMVGIMGKEENYHKQDVNDDRDYFHRYLYVFKVLGNLPEDQKLLMLYLLSNARKEMSA